MDTSFKGWLLTKTDEGTRAELTDIAAPDLPDGDVTVAISHSTINYKDGLAFTGQAPVIRSWPMVPGIDFAGTVLESEHDRFKPGDRVLLNGWGVGETHWGGLATCARVKGDWLLPCPEPLSNAECMAIGTAGYTAALCVIALETQGITPSDGPVLVTGAAGGVGSIAIALLHKAGYSVIASTGRSEEAPYLTSLGAETIMNRADLSEPGRPLGKEKWAAAIDCVGSHTLSNVVSQTRYGGAVACCGLAQGMDLPMTVAPFILRGIRLIGVDSVMVTLDKRRIAWDRLATDLKSDLLANMTITRPLADAQSIARDIVDGKIRGRVVIDVTA